MEKGQPGGKSETRCARTPFAYGRWLAVWGGALALLLRREKIAERLVWTEDAGAALLLGGFPALLGVPVSLFGEAAARVPGCCRIAAAGKDEEALLALIRLVEHRSGERFDWDAFLTRTGRLSRRRRLLETAADALCGGCPAEFALCSPSAVLASLSALRRRA